MLHQVLSCRTCHVHRCIIYRDGVMVFFFNFATLLMYIIHRGINLSPSPSDARRYGVCIPALFKHMTTMTMLVNVNQTY